MKQKKYSVPIQKYAIKQKKKVQQILKTLVRNTTFKMFQNKKFKRNTNAAIAGVALCTYKYTLPTS